MIAVLGGGLLALATYSAERELSVGRIELSVQPFHSGALDLYVPLVDWGARFGAVRLPARLSIDVRTVDREAAERLAGGQLPDVEAVRRRGARRGGVLPARAPAGGFRRSASRRG